MGFDASSGDGLIPKRIIMHSSGTSASFGCSIHVMKRPTFGNGMISSNRCNASRAGDLLPWHGPKRQVEFRLANETLLLPKLAMIPPLCAHTFCGEMDDPEPIPGARCWYTFSLESVEMRRSRAVAMLWNGYSNSRRWLCPLLIQPHV